MQRIRGRKVDILAWTSPDEIEGVALEQLKNISLLPWVFHHVAAMPDVHFGKGATVGSVIAMKGAVSPAAVGVDVGCGVGAVRTSLSAGDLPDDLRAWRGALERAIPVGFHEHRNAVDLRRVPPRPKPLNERPQRAMAFGKAAAAFRRGFFQSETASMN